MFVAIGVAIRILLATIEGNHDFVAWMFLSDVRLAGENVYDVTLKYNYNYGPAWFLVLEGARHVANTAYNWAWIFRLEIAVLLTAADLGIATIVAIRYGLTRGIAFFLVPISMIISGYHGQFDNIAILLALAGVILWDRDRGRGELSATQLTGAILIGTSLVFKHIMFLLPLWLAMRTQNRIHRAVIITVPYVLFGGSFVPFLGDGGRHAVLQNVVLYKSNANAPLWTPLGLGGLATLLVVVALVAAGFKTRRLEVIDAVGVYLLVLVVASPAVVNQSLVIPLLLIVARSNIFTYAYVAVTTLLLLGHFDGLGIQWFADLFPFSLEPPVHQQWQVYFPSIVLLALAGGFAWRDADRESRPPTPLATAPQLDDEVGNPAQPGGNPGTPPPDGGVETPH